eukprot:TRINITY_DN8424_c0_g2_i3.p1 TRINITY_DN8424_c0_g2~~TRINITY_DN8424_c0_g2_i3.p1  ORF type:complete len:181 (+),score=35.92 TRINITY_DN8424_c0_g2_i3:176-718(+)
MIEKLRMESGLPKTGVALDLACGSGRDGIFLARRGWKTINVDHSELQLSKAQEMARNYGVTELAKFVLLDLETNPRELNEYHDSDLVNVARYLERSIFDDIKKVVSPGGFLVFHTFMKSCSKPRRMQFKLEPGELSRVFSPPEWVVIQDSTYIISDGRETCWFLAQKKKIKVSRIGLEDE